MFGCPPNYLHSKEMYKVLKKAEGKKATIRQAPSKRLLLVCPSVLCCCCDRRHGRSRVVLTKDYGYPLRPFPPEPPVGRTSTENAEKGESTCFGFDVCFFRVLDLP